MQTSDVRARAMKTRSAHWLDGSVVHGMKGKHFPCSRETKEILREKNSGKEALNEFAIKTQINRLNPVIFLSYG